MADQPTQLLTRDEAVRAYKQLLQTYVDRRPSGTRQKIALALGKHKSFVSQITNPTYPAPVPAHHVGTIFEICHFSPEERAAFLAAYATAHPRRSSGLLPAREGGHVIQIEVPNVGDPRLQRELEETIRLTASRIIALLTRR